jgi:hypothetical protein
LFITFAIWHFAPLEFSSGSPFANCTIARLAILMMLVPVYLLLFAFDFIFWLFSPVSNRFAIITFYK